MRCENYFLQCKISVECCLEVHPVISYFKKVFNYFFIDHENGFDHDVLKRLLRFFCKDPDSIHIWCKFFKLCLTDGAF